MAGDTWVHMYIKKRSINPSKTLYPIGTFITLKVDPAHAIGII